MLPYTCFWDASIMKHSFVYIMTNQYWTTFYIGRILNLYKRSLEHALS